MKTHEFAFHFALTGLVLTAACGDDSSALFGDMQGPGAAGAGTAGTSGGASSSNGGSSSSSGGSVETSGGTTGTAGGAGTSGGAGGTDGSAGTTASGGTGGEEGGAAGASGDTGGTIGAGGGDGSGGVGGTGAPVGCPASAPEDGEACNPDEVDGPCRYAGVACACGGFLGGDANEWSCVGDDDECPMAPPDEGSSCDPNGRGALLCPYPDASCVCAAFNRQWLCFGGQ